jgi:hypothetical protein
MIKNLSIAVSVFLIILLSGLVYFQSKPTPVNTPKVSTGQLPAVTKIYPENIQANGGNFYQGKLYKTGKINIVVLEGSYEEMGRQYGALLKDELNANYQGIMEGLKKLTGITAKDLQKEGNEIYATYPEKYKKIVNGLAITSGLGLEKARFLLAQEGYVFAGLLSIAKDVNISGSTQCSGIAAWGAYTSDGSMLFGRNYDLGPVNHEHMTLTVYNPSDGSIPTANFTYTGSIYITSGMNREGLMLELNNGSASDNSDFSNIRQFALISLFAGLEQSRNNEELTTYLNTTLPDLSYIINAADKESAYSFEWSTSKVRRREPDKNGLMVATNIFFDPAWGKQKYNVSNDMDFIVKRRDNLIALADKYKGNITPAKMMEIMATPLEEGGSFRAPNFTSYQYVAQPSTLKMWLRVPEYQDWTEVNLALFFNK